MTSKSKSELFTILKLELSNILKCEIIERTIKIIVFEPVAAIKTTTVKKLNDIRYMGKRIKRSFFALHVNTITQ